MKKSADGSEDPDTWGTDYGSEVQFKEAFEAGLVASARSGWQDGRQLGRPVKEGNNPQHMLRKKINSYLSRPFQLSESLSHSG